MKLFLLLGTLSLLASYRAEDGLESVKCTANEMGIRWPSYTRKTDYYVCSKIGGTQVKMSCEDGEMFCFVLQACTLPNNFIPAPPVEDLPIDSEQETEPALHSNVSSTKAPTALKAPTVPKAPSAPKAPTAAAASSTSEETAKAPSIPSKKSPVLPSKKSPPVPGAAKKSPQLPKKL